jgi:hypothetical protein
MNLCFLESGGLNGEEESEVRTLAKIRDTLLPKLISGELRIEDAEKLAVEVAG